MSGRRVRELTRITPLSNKKPHSKLELLSVSVNLPLDHFSTTLPGKIYFLLHTRIHNSHPVTHRKLNKTSDKRWPLGISERTVDCLHYGTRFGTYMSLFVLPILEPGGPLGSHRGLCLYCCLLPKSNVNTVYVISFRVRHYSWVGSPQCLLKTH